MPMQVGGASSLAADSAPGPPKPGRPSSTLGRETHYTTQGRMPERSGVRPQSGAHRFDSGCGLDTPAEPHPHPAARGHAGGSQQGPAAAPEASNLNFTAGETIPNLVIVPVGADGKVDFYNDAGSVNLVADLAGCYMS